MFKRLIVLFCSLVGLLWASDGICQVKCVDAEGEAAILNNDIPSAKAEATARAKWSAIEQAVGVEVKAQSIVQNMALVDDAVSKQIRGIVTGHKTLKEENRRDTVWVKINACIQPAKAQEAVSALALNSSVAVFILARPPRGAGEGESRAVGDDYEESNVLSETLIGKLTERGYTVVDVAPTHAVDAREIENAIKRKSFLTLRGLVYKFLANVVVIGKTDYTISTTKGQDVGYGMSMPFNTVTVRLVYRIVTRDKTGNMVILGAGSEKGKGLANTVEEAAANSLEDLAEKFAPVLLEKMSEHMIGVAKKVNVKVLGVTDINANFAVKDVLQNTAWVTNVEEKALGEFVVTYPENPIYLANSMQQRGMLRVVDFSSGLITVQYQR